MKSGYFALAACLVVSLLLGSIHAFSVFVPEWERIADTSRASVSLIYSLALVSLTVAVLFGHVIFRLLSPCLVFVLVALVVGLGLSGAAFSKSVWELYLYYGLLFGAANGLGYGYTLQLSGRTVPIYRSQAMVLVTAFYAVGATAAPFILSRFIESGGNSKALFYSAIFFSISILAASAVVFISSVRYESETVGSRPALTTSERRTRTMLWAGYGCAVTAGLMVLGHAYGIAIWLGLNSGTAVWAVTCVAAGNMFGGFSSVYLCSITTTRILLRSLPALTAIGLLIILLPLWITEMTNEGGGKLSVLMGLFLAGFSYGAIIAIYPVAVTNTFGVTAAPRIYGQIFTAWGVAGLLGPWFSGWLFDRGESYTIALLIAIVLSIFSMLVVGWSYRETESLT